MRLITVTRLHLKTKITIEIFLFVRRICTLQIFFRPKSGGYPKHLINGVYSISKKIKNHRRREWRRAVHLHLPSFQTHIPIWSRIGDTFLVREEIYRGVGVSCGEVRSRLLHPQFRGGKHILNGSRHFKSIYRHNGISRQNGQEYTDAGWTGKKRLFPCRIQRRCICRLRNTYFCRS